MLRTILNNKLLLWAVVALPAVYMILAWLTGRTDAADLLHPSGEFSARLMIIAMMIGPLVSIFGTKRWLLWLTQRRRTLGVTAFAYALLHFLFYLIDMETLAAMLAEFGALGIWTGWAAFVLMMAAAIVSNNAAVRLLKRDWKRVQKLLYPAAVLTLIHWMFVHNNLVAAIIHFVPLALLWGARAICSSTPINQGV